jgi:Transcription elongation factor, GreA/GreB, C-term
VSTPDGVLNELVEMLTRMGIEPVGKSETSRPERRFTEHRTIEPAAAEQPSSAEVGGIDLDGLAAMAEDATLAATGIGLGDKVVLIFADDHKRISARLTEGANDLEKGRLSVSSPLGKSILGAEEGDEVELPLENGRPRKVLIESVEKSPIVVAVSGGIENAAEGAAAVA